MRPRRSDRFRVSIVQTLVVVVGMAVSGTAGAMSPFQVLEPANYTLSFHQVVSGVRTPVQQIHLRNTTAEPATGDARCCSVGFDMVGDLNISVDAGHDVSWDISCLTDDPAGASTYFDLDYCGSDCDQVSGLMTFLAVCSPPVMSLSALQLDFPAIPASVPQQQTVTITNLTSGTVTWPVAVTGAGFALVGDAAITLAAGASGEVTVGFRPTASGDHAGTLVIGAPDGLDHFAVPLAGTATTPMVTADSALAFGEVAVGHTGAAMLAIHNLDTAHGFRIAQLAIDVPAFTATLAGDATLAPGATVMVPVQFTPTAAGAHAAQLSVVLDGADAPIATADLTGQGVGHGGGGCNATGSPGAGLGLALLALVRRRRTRR
jgi:uncharacterized protein (TIGR03382 family)